MIIKIKRNSLCDWIWKNKINLSSDFLCDYILNLTKHKNISEKQKDELKKQVFGNFSKRYKLYWRKSERSKSRFLIKFSDWLQGSERFCLSETPKKKKISKCQCQVRSR